ncbi:hypothetical protein [Streptomyces albogriseolus]|uniref:hypothetical protein n=1 Tax=Streptomyces albogriseolus TaxID=1887 RepID=UPI0034605350
MSTPEEQPNPEAALARAHAARAKMAAALDKAMAARTTCPKCRRRYHHVLPLRTLGSCLECHDGTPADPATYITPPAHGALPYGWQARKKELIEEEMEQARRARERQLQDEDELPCREIAAVVEAEKIRPKCGDADTWNPFAACSPTPPTGHPRCGNAPPEGDPRKVL